MTWYSLMSTPSCSAKLLGLARGADVEPDDDRRRRLRQADVRLGDAADARRDDVDADVVGRQLGQRVRDRLDRALHVGLEHDLDLLDLARLDLVEDVLERHAAVPASSFLRRASCRCSTSDLAAFSSLTTLNISPASGTPSRPSTSTGRRRTGLGHRLPLVAQHGADLPGVLARHDQIAELQRPLFDEDRRDRAARAVQPRLDDVPLAALFGLAFSSRSSACRLSISSSLSTPSFVLADTFT